MKTFKITLCTLLLAMATFSSTACVKASVHPGAINQVDSSVYDTLLSVQKALEQAKTDIGPTPTPAVRAAFNTASTAYNTAHNSYVAYHDLLARGGNPDATALQQQVAQVITSVAALTTQIKGLKK